MSRDLLAIATLVLLGIGCAHDAPRSGSSVHSAVSSPDPRSWRVYDGDLEILDVTDQPGPLVSTAPLPPGAAPAMHPFLSATALDAGHENQLRELLGRSHDIDDFVHRLEAAGFRVVVE